MSDSKAVSDESKREEKHLVEKFYVEEGMAILAASKTLLRVHPSEVWGLLRHASDRQTLAETLSAWRPDLEETIRHCLDSLKS